MSFLQNSLTKSVWALTAGRYDEEVIGQGKSSLIKTSLFTTQFVNALNPKHENYVLRNKKVIDLNQLFTCIKKNMKFPWFGAKHIPLCAEISLKSSKNISNFTFCGLPMFSSNNHHYLLKLEKQFIEDEKKKASNQSNNSSFFSRKLFLEEMKNSLKSFYENLEYSSFDKNKNQKKILSESFVDLCIKKFENEEEKKIYFEQNQNQNQNQKGENIELKDFWEKCEPIENGEKTILIEGKAGIGKVLLFFSISFFYIYIFFFFSWITKTLNFLFLFYFETNSQLYAKEFLNSFGEVSCGKKKTTLNSFFIFLSPNFALLKAIWKHSISSWSKRE